MKYSYKIKKIVCYEKSEDDLTNMVIINKEQ